MNNIELTEMKKFFLGANTPSGFVSYFNQIGEYRKDWNRFLIKGGPGTGKSSLMKSIANEFKRLSTDIELIYCSSDPDSLDGVILNDLKVSIADATAPHVLEPNFPGAFENTISICDCWDNYILDENRDEVISLFEENSFYQKQTMKLMLSAYGLIKNNYDIIDRYIDKEAVFRYADELFNKEFGLLRETDNIIGEEKKRFLSAVSVGDIVFYKETINKIVDKIYIIDDPYGPISHNILSILKERLLRANIDVISCYCSIFSGNKIDHILIPSLKVAFVTSNDYHQFVREDSKIINHNDFVSYINEYLETQIKFNQDESKKIINKASMFLQEAKYIHDRLEKCYNRAMNFKLVDEKAAETIKKIKLFIKK